MLANECSITTVGIYLRSLRTLFGIEILEGRLTKEAYPFGKKRYEIPTGHNVKKALTLTDIGAIYNFQALPDSTADMAKNYWLFLYLCNGMNMKDMCQLRYSNLKGNVLEFERAKTARTKRKVEAIRMPLSEDIQAIIGKWGVAKQDENSYIFPVLSKGLSPERQRALVQQRTHLVNEHMKEIAKELKIENSVTTYAARHSFATILQRSGAPISFISEALGHGNVQTTQNYLAGFEDDSKAEVLKALTAFKRVDKTVLKAV
jgi:integrase